MRFQKTFATACAALLLAIGITGYSWTKTPVSYISIDVNPSIELSLNRFGRVVSATAFNAEGRKILETLSLKATNRAYFRLSAGQLRPLSLKLLKMKRCKPFYLMKRSLF